MEDKENILSINPIEFFYPTMRLRWVEKEVEVTAGIARIERVLQQLWQGNTGAQKWEDIELIKQDEI